MGEESEQQKKDTSQHLEEKRLAFQKKTPTQNRPLARLTKVNSHQSHQQAFLEQPDPPLFPLERPFLSVFTRQPRISPQAEKACFNILIETAIVEMWR